MRVALAGCGLLLGIGLFSPRMKPVLWHLQHGDYIAYQGKSFFVPGNWYAYSDYHIVQFLKPHLTVLSLGRPSPVWSFFELLPPQSEPLEARYERFEVYYKAYRVTAKEDVKGPIRLGAGDREAVCMTSFAIQGRSPTFISCLIFAGRWTAEFVGEAQEAENFMEVIRSTTESRAGR